MQTQEHAQTAIDFLEAADREFASGDVLQGSEKLWGAARHAVMMAAQQRGWPYSKHGAVREAVNRSGTVPTAWLRLATEPCPPTNS